MLTLSNIRKETMIQKNLQKLFEKPMNRREFLAHVGAGTLAVIGVSGLIKTLLAHDAAPHRHVATGYGSSPYGGQKK